MNKVRKNKNMIAVLGGTLGLAASIALGLYIKKKRKKSKDNK